MKMANYGRVIASFLSILILLLLSSPLNAAITNEDFSQDPEGYGWDFIPYDNIDVTSDSTSFTGNGFAFLRPNDEQEESFGWIKQSDIYLSPTDLALSFDFTMTKSIPGGETDVFTAAFGSFNFVLESSDIPGMTCSGTVVVDLTGWSAGPYNLVFGLFNEPDGIYTTVAIDNVQLIPAPDAAMLTMLGLSCIGFVKRIRHCETIRNLII
jgi:hypothetical protein